MASRAEHKTGTLFIDLAPVCRSSGMEFFPGLGVLQPVTNADFVCPRLKRFFARINLCRLGSVTDSNRLCIALYLTLRTRDFNDLAQLVEPLPSVVWL